MNGNMVARAGDYLGMVKFSHTLFALPFALASMVWAAQGLPSWRLFILILLAMTTCRNAAMAFNRLMDARIDRENPRTAKRHIPAGILSGPQVWAFFALNALGFVGAAWAINSLAFLLAFPALVAVCGYSLTKRFTSFSHFFLGLAIGISPVGAWIAVRGAFAWEPLLLCLALTLWIAGFDIIYATQDYEFDRRKGLHSMVVRLGLPNALRLSMASHGCMLIVLFALGLYSKMGLVYYASVVLAAMLLVYMHLFRRSASLESMNQDFFLANIAVSFCVFFGVAATWLI